MDCSCTINIDHDGGPSCFKKKIRTARKEHRCCECFKTIVPGEQYEYISGIWDGEPRSYKTCLDCQSMRDTFFDSWIYTEIWDNFQAEFGYPDSVVPEECIAQLTPNARAKICDWIESGWGD